MLTLIAAACWAVYTVFGATILRRHSPLVTTTWAIVAGTLFMAPLGIAQLATSGPVGRSDLPVVLAILYSGTLAAGFANVIVFHGVKLLGPTRVTALQFLVPALAVGDGGDLPRRADPRRSSSSAASIILAGVALLRRGSWPSGATAVERAVGDRRDDRAGRRRRRPSRRCSPASRRWPSSSTTTGRSP